MIGCSQIFLACLILVFFFCVSSKLKTYKEVAAERELHYEQRSVHTRDQSIGTLLFVGAGSRAHAHRADVAVVVCAFCLSARLVEDLPDEVKPPVEDFAPVMEAPPPVKEETKREKRLREKKQKATA